MTIMTLVETGDSISASTLSANIEHAKIRRTFIFGEAAQALSQAGIVAIQPKNPPTIPAQGVFTSPTPQDILETINAVIGNTLSIISETAPGRLTRTLPMSDPQIPYWYASKIDSLKGVGQGEFIAAPTSIFIENSDIPITSFNDFIVQNQPAGFLIYPSYLITILFEPVPYPVFLDQYIPVTQQVFYPPAFLTGPPAMGSGEPAFAGYNEAPEWQRFCYFDIQAIDDYIVSNTGQMVFREEFGVGSLNNVPFTGPPRMYLPNDLVTFKWYGVPLRYVTSPNSFIRGFRGYINQYPFWDTPSTEAIPVGNKVFQAGSLLYLSYKVQPYTPPITQAAALLPANLLPPLYASPARMVNLEFTCLYTNRKPANTLTVTPVNSNWLAAGHNLLPSFIDRGFHYATSVSQPSLQFNNPGVFGAVSNFVADQMSPQLWVPSFQSFPIEILWSDPDAPGALVPNINVGIDPDDDD